jgi:hypothetical protein
MLLAAAVSSFGACCARGQGTAVYTAAAVEPAAPAPLQFQSVNLGGEWSGVLMQPGGPHDYYGFSMRLAQSGTSVTGSSMISIPQTPYYGVLELTGSVNELSFSFSESSVVDQNLPESLRWCIKSGTLTYDPAENSLRGSWSAPDCSPGEIQLRKVK